MRDGKGRWTEIVGLVDVTVPGYDSATARRVVRSNGLKFRGDYVYLDPLVDKSLDSVFRRRHIEEIRPASDSPDAQTVV